MQADPTLVPLPGGTQGVLLTTRATPLAHVTLAVSAGYLDEPAATPGLAHLLEHVLLTQPGPDGHSLLALAARLGGKLNARTDDLVTDIHATLPVASLPAFLARLGQALFAPTFDDATLAGERRAIDAEYRARHATPAMRRLAALRQLSLAEHPAAVCHHGNEASLALPLERLKAELARFHQRYGDPAHLTIGLAAPLPRAEQQRLIAACLPANSASQRETRAALAPRWRTGADQQGVINDEGQPTKAGGKAGRDEAETLELLWPLTGQALARHMPQLRAWEQALNDGALIAPLEGVASDYQANLCPSGAGDTLSLTLQPLPGKRQALLARTDALGQALDTLLAASASAPQPAIHHTSLADWLFGYTRQQAIAQRFAHVSADADVDVDKSSHGQARLARTTPLILATASDHPAPHGDSPRPPDTPPASVTSRAGSGGGFGLPPDWAACFVPEDGLALPALAEKRLAQRGITLLQQATPKGSWLCALAARPLNDAPGEVLSEVLSDMLTRTWRTPLAPPGGLQAHRLLAELEPAPKRPFIWAAHHGTAAALATPLAVLPKAPGKVALGAPDGPSQSGSEHTELVTLMRTFQLPGNSANRQILAATAQRHGAPFFHAMRQTHQLGYIAAVRYVDGHPASLAYLVQCANADAQRAKGLMQAEIERLWAATLADMQADTTLATPSFTGLDTPETQSAILLAHWRAQLNGSQLPLYRLTPAPTTDATGADWQRRVADPTRWQWWQRPG